MLKQNKEHDNIKEDDGATLSGDIAVEPAEPYKKKKKTDIIKRIEEILKKFKTKG